MAALNNHDLTREITGPSRSAVAVTPSDSTDLVYETRWIYIGGNGALTVTLADMADGTSVTYTAMAVGYQHLLAIKRIWATGTTATGIVAAY